MPAGVGGFRVVFPSGIWPASTPTTPPMDPGELQQWKLTEIDGLAVVPLPPRFFSSLSPCQEPTLTESNLRFTSIQRRTNTERSFVSHRGTLNGRLSIRLLLNFCRGPRLGTSNRSISTCTTRSRRFNVPRNLRAIFSRPTSASTFLHRTAVELAVEGTGLG